MFPVLFTTVACGAISGFHSLVSSGTTSKQLDKEKDAKPIAYGGMLLECVLAVLTLCAIGYAYKWNAANPDSSSDRSNRYLRRWYRSHDRRCHSGKLQHPELSAGTDLLRILSDLSGYSNPSCTFHVPGVLAGAGRDCKDVKEGWKKVMVNPYFATILTVVLGILLGMTGYAKIWGLFGAANQLLAGIGLLAVATWLGNATARTIRCS